jgi:protein gp37
MQNSKIEWCDHTANFWSGCTKVSPACAHCYAETLAKRFPHFGQWGEGKPRAWHGKNAIKDLRRYNKVAGCFPMNPRPRVFINSLSDWLDDEVPVEWLVELLEAIHICRNLDFLLLTKRPQNFLPRMQAALQTDKARTSMQLGCQIANWITGHRWKNVWIGTTAENQEWADKRIPLLLDIPASIRFLSCEPLLGPLDLTPLIVGEGSLMHVATNSRMAGIHWIICGGESGPHARPMHPKWARTLRDQCAQADVPFFFKQWGEWLPLTPLYDGRDEDAEDGCNPDRTAVLHDNGHLWPWEHGQPPIENSPWIIERTGKHAAGRLLDGIEHSAFPNSSTAH